MITVFGEVAGGINLGHQAHVETVGETHRKRENETALKRFIAQAILVGGQLYERKQSSRGTAPIVSPEIDFQARCDIAKATVRFHRAAAAIMSSSGGVGVDDQLQI